MLKAAVEYLYSIIVELLTGMNGLGSGLNASLGKYNQVYNGAVKVGTNIAYPIATQILAIFLGIELIHVCLRALENGGSTAISGCMKATIKFMVCYNILLRWRTILVALFNISKQCTSGIENQITVPEASSIWNNTTSGLLESIEQIATGEALAAIPLLLIALLIVLLATLFVKVIIMLRFINLYVLLAFAPIPMATLMGEGQWNMGIGFLKNWLGACFHGCVLFFVIKCYTLFGQYFMENTNSLIGACASIMGVNILLIVVLFSTERTAMKIFGA